MTYMVKLTCFFYFNRYCEYTQILIIGQLRCDFVGKDKEEPQREVRDGGLIRRHLWRCTCHLKPTLIVAVVIRSVLTSRSQTMMAFLNLIHGAKNSREH